MNLPEGWTTLVGRMTQQTPQKRELQEGWKNLPEGWNRRVTKVARKGKKRGPNRQTVTLEGVKKMDKSLKRRTKRKMNRDLGKAGIPARKKSRMEKVMQEPPISVMFIDNTKNGLLAKR